MYRRIYRKLKRTIFSNSEVVPVKTEQLTIKQKVARMNEYNHTNFKYVEGRNYDDKMSVSGNHLKSGLGAGFHGILIDYIEKYKPKNAEKVAIIAESDEVAQELKKAFPWATTIINIVDYKDKKTGDDFDVDLNIKHNFKSEYDVVLSQALLEHVSNPFMAVENFTDLLKKGGVLILHTHNYKMPYHACPIDCVRYFKDWFVDLQKYLPIKMVDFLEADVHMFCAYRKK